LTRGTNTNPDLEGLIRRLALNDTAAIASVLGTPADDESSRLGGEALAAGATEDDVIGVLAVVAPIVGTARVAAAVPELGAALGFAPVQA
jgi:alkylhydroperoxidase/carboxymuconolactone decarboxylase family protein YurZ